MTAGAHSSYAGVRPVLMLELNELCPPIIDRMMAKGELPNFKALHERSDVHVTWTDDNDLEPWVQWVTLHTGKTQDVHHATQLDEGHRIDLPRVWDMLADRGFKSLIFGSMNAKTKSENVFLVPDPWSSRVKPSDPRFNAFHEFIAHNVTEHTNANAKASKKQTIDFIRFMLSHGLSLDTVMTAVRQIAGEKTASHDQRWRRALVLDLMMWDVFEKEYRRQRPAFATFFANSTAFLQHRYWRHMEPEAYQVKPNETDMAAYGGAIADSYRHMDKLVGRAMKLVGPGGRIVFATALSQEANLRYEHVGGKFVFRPKDFQAFNTFIGGPAGLTFEPVMTHQAWASCKTKEEADQFEEALKGLTSNGDPVSWWWREDDNRVFFWCKLISKPDGEMPLTNKAGERRDFSELYDGVGQVNNSQHNRNGCFWVQRPQVDSQSRQSTIHAGLLPLEQTTQMLLDLFPSNEPRRASAPQEQRETVAA